MPDDKIPVDEAAAEDSGPDLSMVVGQIAEALGLTDAGTELGAILQAILEKVRGGSGDGDSEDGGDAETAASLRKVFKLADDADADAIIVAAKNALDKETLSAGSLATLGTRVKELEGAQAADAVDKAIAGYMGTKINPQDAKFVASCRRFAERDLKEFVDHMDVQPDVMPPSGVMGAPDEPGPQTRDGIIVAAKRDFASDPRHGKMTGEVDFVAMALRDGALPALTDDERTKLAVFRG